jgi:LmbE family N-acetylglucosaminyl deacetylase
MKRVLILAAHLDDSVLAMGGSIRKLVKFGATGQRFLLWQR